MTELKKYQAPEIRATIFDAQDVITLSIVTGRAAVDVEAGWIEDEAI